MGVIISLEDHLEREREEIGQNPYICLTYDSDKTCSEISGVRGDERHSEDICYEDK